VVEVEADVFVVGLPLLDGSEMDVFRDVSLPKDCMGRFQLLHMGRTIVSMR